MNLVQQLRKFRQASEREAGTAASEIQVPLSAVLEDVCRSAKMTDKQRQSVVGRNNVVRFETTHIAPVLKTKRRKR